MCVFLLLLLAALGLRCLRGLSVVGFSLVAAHRFSCPAARGISVP